MDRQEAINIARGIAYVSGVLVNHQQEPLCGSCRALVKTSGAVREALDTYRGAGGPEMLPAEMTALLGEASGRLAGLRLPADPVPQRKVGACLLPEKGCFLKYSRAFLDRIIEG